MTKQTELFDAAIHHRNKLERVLRLCRNVQIADGCCEPGYADKPVALGDWNDKTKYHHKTGKYVVTDHTMPRIARILEKMGYECEWEDEWHICDKCGKAIRCQPDSYSWKPYYWNDDGTVTCGDCVKNDPLDYLEFLSGNPNKALTFDIDLSKHGYRLHTADYENGLHKGPHDNPRDIADGLRSEGFKDFIFVLDSTNQFGINFSVWVKETEKTK